jgi:spermidine/putrescine transport system ATP-binding protein
MHDGRIVQTGSPRELYDRPASRYVAGFVGKSNFFEGVVDGSAGTLTRIGLPGGICIDAPAAGFASGQRVAVSIRPEQLIAARDPAHLPADSALKVPARVLNRIFLGEHTEYLLRSDQLGDFLVLAPRQSELSERPFDTGEDVHVAWSREAALVLGSE